MVEKWYQALNALPTSNLINRGQDRLATDKFGLMELEECYQTKGKDRERKQNFNSLVHDRVCTI